jgi:hypothetical protein
MRVRILCGVFALSLFCVDWGSRLRVAQDGEPTQIEVGANVRVSNTLRPYVEPYIAANPRNPQNIVIATSEVIHDKGIFARAFYTIDGGETWSLAELPVEPGMLTNAAVTELDSWLAFAPDGTPFYSTLADINFQGRDSEFLLVWRSQDGGRTWQGPAVTPSRTFDAPHITATMKGSQPQVYVSVGVMGSDPLFMPGGPATWGVAVLRSDDGGVSFKRTAFISHDQLNHNGLNPVVLLDGSVLVPFNDYTPHPTRVPVKVSRIYVVRSEDGGQTFSLPWLVTEIPRVFPDRPRFAQDSSAGKFRGRIYVVWNGEAGEQRNVSVAYSTDDGKFWSRPVTFRAPNAGPAHQTTLAVAQDGTIGIAWLQHELTNPRCYRIHFAASTDGAATFSQPASVSEKVSCPDTKANKETTFPRENQSVLGRWVRGGDYIGLAAAPDGSFHVVWTDSRDEVFQTYTARIQVRK